jgi:hypothetical protein
MNEQTLKNVFTLIIKEEKVKSLDHNIVENSAVIEIDQPFPGYYSSPDFIHSESKPQTIFIALDDRVELDFFYRKISRIKKYSAYHFVADLAELIIADQVYHCVRINELETYESISDIEKYFLDEGFIIRKFKSISNNAHIKIYKFANYRIENGLYYSDRKPDFIYFEVPSIIAWQKLEQITIKIRNIFFRKKFDAALGTLIYQGLVTDIVRIYAKNLDESEVQQLREMYLKAINNT